MMYDINFCRKNLNKHESLYVIHQLESANLMCKIRRWASAPKGRCDDIENRESINDKKMEPDNIARPHPA